MTISTRLKTLLALLAAAAVLLTVPRRWCGREADALFDGTSPALLGLARQVQAQVQAGVSTRDFRTGSRMFDREWVFGSYQMAGLGLAQVALSRPALRPSLVPTVERCVDGMIGEAGRAFDRQAWGSDPLATLHTDQGHAAYLGYLNLVLGLLRQLSPGSRHAGLHERVSRALIRRMQASRSGLLATYPGIGFPVDTAAVVGSIALHGRVTGRDTDRLVTRWADAMVRRYIHRPSGLLVQAAHPVSGKWLGAPRASGTALAAYFAAFAHRDLSRRLLNGLRRSVATSWLGFGLIREYPRSVPAGRGDIDSGPMVFGLSFSGTGFALAASKIHGDAPLFAGLYSTAHLVGAPLDRKERRRYVTGGPLGNAIMLAMLSAGEGVAR